jgi:predicted AAA+ superfamily ATPase
LLYGGRRLGKSTILRNLDGLLPEPVMPVVVSMGHPGVS